MKNEAFFSRISFSEAGTHNMQLQLLIIHGLWPVVTKDSHELLVCEADSAFLTAQFVLRQRRPVLFIAPIPFHCIVLLDETRIEKWVREDN
jgi:hypothetical protein